jgi:hypothetical protein
MAGGERIIPATSLFKNSDVPTGTRPGDIFLGDTVIFVGREGVRTCETRSAANCALCIQGGENLKKRCESPAS